MITVRSTINLAHQSVPEVIPAVQGDTGRSILFSLADFTIPAGATARYFITKPSGLAVYNDATIDGNTVLVDLTAQSLAEYGDCPGQVRISFGDTVVTSFEFILHVEPFRGIDAVESTTETNIFDKAVDDAREAIAEAAEEAKEYISQALDTTLTIPDKAADAKATGDAISDSADAVIAQMRAEIANVYPTETAQGNPASFTDGAESIPVKDIKVSIVPNQDLHGYDKPWPAGGGKNLLPMTVAGIKAANTSGTWSGNAYIFNGVTFTVNTDSNGNVISISARGTNTGNFASCYLDIWNFGTDLNGKTVICSADSTADGRLRIIGFNGLEFVRTGKSATVSVPEDATSALFRVCVESGELPSGATIYPMIRLSTVSDATFAPYSNICPITGYESVDVVRCGKNLCDNSAFVVGSISGTGEDTQSYTRLHSPFIKVSPNTTYTYASNSEIYVYELHYYDKDKRWIRYDSVSAVSTTVSDANAEFVKVLLRKSDNSVMQVSDGATFQMEKGSTATPYEPYKGQTATIDLGRTVYGGTLDVTSGVLTVNKKMVKIGDLNWTTQAGNYGRFTFTTSDAFSNTNVVSVICDCYPSYSDSNKPAYINGIYIGGANGTGIIKIYDTQYPNTSDLSSWKTARADNYIVYELATPQTYQLTPQELLSVLGTNHISTDAESVDVEYRADIALYIENLTKPGDDDMIANRAIASGKFFMVGNRLFLSTASIANGATINPGTNCTELSLSDALNSLA